MAARLIDTINITKMLPDDLLSVYQIEKDSYDFPWSEKIIEDCLLNNYDCFIAKNSRTVGYVIAKISSLDSHILNLTIDANYRGYGIGSSFVDLIIKECRLQGSHSIFLEARVTNLVARKLYQKYGFRSIGLRKNYYKNKSGREDAIVYRKNLIY